MDMQVIDSILALECLISMSNGYFISSLYKQIHTFNFNLNTFFSEKFFKIVPKEI